MGGSMATQYQLHTQLQSKPSRNTHLVALLGAPTLVYAAAYAVWTILKQQCAAFTAPECLPVGSTELIGSDVALLATFLAAGIIAIIEIAID